MSPTKQDDETAEQTTTPDFLKELGISPEEQQEMEDAAYSGAADDMAEREGLSGADLKTAEESGSGSSKKGRPENKELDKIGDGYNEEDKPGRGRRLIDRFKGASKKKKYAAITGLLGGLGLLGSVIALILSLSGIFRLDSFLNAVESKAFIRYQVDMEGRSTKWINAYMGLRLLEVDDPNLAPADRDNLLFRANRVDNNNPTTDWYKSMRASTFEADLAKNQGIRFTSIVYKEDGITKFRPAIVTVNEKPLNFKNFGNAADQKKMSDLLETFDTKDFDINKFNGVLKDGLDIQVLNNDKEGRQAIKHFTKENTKSYQFIKRFYIRKSIQNMTGIRDWRFFETTRNNLTEKRIGIRNKIIAKAIPDSTKSGKVIQCLFGIIPCKAQPDPNDPQNHAEIGPNGKTCSSSEPCENRKNADGTPDTTTASDGSAGSSVEGGVSDAVTAGLGDIQAKILERTLKNLNLATGIISTMDTLNTLDNVIKSGAIATTIYMARQAQDIGLFTTFGIARDQIHTGQVADSAEIGDMMKMMDGVGTSEGWNKIIDGNNASGKASAAALQPSKSEKEYCSQEHQAAMLLPENRATAESEYHYMCPSEKIGAATRGSELQDAWNGSIGALLQPILAPYRASGPLKDVVGFANGLIDKIVGPVITGIMKASGLGGTIKDLFAWILGKASAFLGASPTYDQNSPTGVYANHALSGAVGSSETAMRFSGGAATTQAAMLDTEKRVLAYNDEEAATQSTFDKYLSTANPSSALSKSLFAVTDQPINVSLAHYASSILTSPLHAITKVKAAAPTGYEGANWAEVNTYDLPSACLDSDPLDSLKADALPAQTNADELGLIPSGDLTWDLLKDSNAFYAKLYELHPDSPDINKVYDCAVMDSMARGGTAGQYVPSQAGPNAIVNGDDGQSDANSTGPGGGITLGTYNLLHETAPGVGDFCTNHGLPADPKQCAVERSKFAAKVITGQAAGTQPLDVFGTQEISPDQQTQLMQGLSTFKDGYNSFPDKVPDFHGVAIFWSKKFTKVGDGYAPGRNNVGQPADVPWVELQDPNGQQFYVMSVHYSNAVSNAGPDTDADNIKKSSQLTLDWVQSKEDADTPVFVVGDFNDSLSQKLSYCAYTQDGLMQHAVDMAAGAPLSEGCTKVRYHGIDHIYSTTDAGISASQFIHYPTQAGAINKASDHQPSVALYKFPGSSDGTVLSAVCYTVTKLSGSSIEGRMLHWSSGISINSYAKENSPEGVKYAANHGYDSIDLDIQMTKDGVPVDTHWGTPMSKDGFFDPQGKLNPDTHVSDMTLAEVTRLRNHDGQSQIHSLDEMIQILANNHVNLSLELKTAALVKAYPEITGKLNQLKVKAYVKANASKSSLNRALTTARDYGYWTRGTLGTQDWKPPSPTCK